MSYSINPLYLKQPGQNWKHYLLAEYSGILLPPLRRADHGVRSRDGSRGQSGSGDQRTGGDGLLIEHAGLDIWLAAGGEAGQNVNTSDGRKNGIGGAGAGEAGSASQGIDFTGSGGGGAGQYRGDAARGGHGTLILMPPDT